MSLFSALQVSSNALRVNQLGLQVVSNNIANANTPGYIRQEMVQAAGTGYRLGSSIVGQGVRSVGVTQRVDEFLLQSLRDVQSRLAASQGLDEANSRLESALSELGDNDISSMMSRFSNAMQDIANQPGNGALRSLAVQRGQELAGGIRNLSSTASQIANSSNEEIRSIASQINGLTSKIADLNQRIVELEGGSISTSDAVGLRDERIKALDELSNLINVKSFEQESGAVTVLVGGDYIVSDGISRPVTVAIASEEEGGNFEVLLSDTQAKLDVTGGQLKGLYDAREGAGSKFVSRLDEFASQIIRQVNRVHSQGQGVVGFTEVVGEPIIGDASAAIEEAGADIDIDNGSFVIAIDDASTGQTKTYDIFVRQQGTADDTSIDNLVAQINQISGLQASVTADGRFQIRSDSSAVKFSFGNDTSGVLSSLGINTFFSGNSSSTIQVRSDLVADPRRLAISLDGPGKGNRNAVALAEAFSTAEESLGGRSMNEVYQDMVAVTSQEINAQKSETAGLQNYYQTLEAKHLGLTGVSLDEEGIRMLMYQRAFQASSRVIAATNQMLEDLVNII
jgi:flagellar hook-associated protein 1 FlgK